MDINKLGGAQSLLALTQVQAANLNYSGSNDEEIKTEADSYSKSEAFPVVSGMYTQSGHEVETVKGIESSGEAEKSGAKPASGGGSGSDEDEEQTKTQIITINGVTYLETRTSSNGVETVTRKVLSGERD